MTPTNRLREAFEAWMRAEYPRYDPTDDTVNIRRYWKMWQAATLVERERCASMLDEAAKDYREIGDAGTAEQTEFLAEYIRA